MINNLKEEISTIKQEMKKMSEIIESQKKVIDEQQDKLEFQQSQIDYLKLLSGFKEIENPWSNEKFKYGDYQLFNYTLKENDYLVEKSDENQNMHLIKSKNQLKQGEYGKITELRPKGLLSESYKKREESLPSIPLPKV